MAESYVPTRKNHQGRALIRHRASLMREFYERIERKHGSSKAIVAVARRMITIMHVLLTRNEPSRGENRHHLNA